MKPKVKPITGAEADRMTWAAIPTWRDEQTVLKTRVKPLVSREWQPERKLLTR